MNLRISKKTLFYGIIAIIFLEPTIFEQASYLKLFDIIFNLGKIVGAMIIFLDYLITFKKFSPCVIIVFLMVFPMFLASVTNNTDYKTGFITMATILSICMLSECMIKANNFFKILVPISICYLIINLILILLFKNGLAHSVYYKNGIYWFLGHKNSITRWCIFFCIIIILKNLYQGHMLKGSKIFITLCLAQIVLTGSSTGLVAIFALIVGLIIANKANIYIFNIDMGYIIYTIICTVFLFVSLEGTFLANLFELLFHKSFTFTGRTVLWGQAIELIKNSWLTGNGYAVGYGFFGMGGENWGAHNTILGILVAGGIVSFAFFIILLFYMKRQIQICNIVKMKNLLSLIILIYLICGLTEEIQACYSMYFVFSFICNYIRLNYVPQIKCSQRKYGHISIS